MCIGVCETTTFIDSLTKQVQQSETNTENKQWITRTRTNCIYKQEAIYVIRVYIICVLFVSYVSLSFVVAIGFYYITICLVLHTLNHSSEPLYIYNIIYLYYIQFIIIIYNSICYYYFCGKSYFYQCLERSLDRQHIGVWNLTMQLSVNIRRN